jgi:hypothetical protein
MKQVDELTARIKDEISRLYYQHSYLKPLPQPEVEPLASRPPLSL